jgi:lipopolysaccharide/colanic/teichoic acid biosynthesis glycosyltransferase
LEWQRYHKLKRDPRITTVGRWLRRYSLDELPQLINILLGHMSLVGPRPIVESEIKRYATTYDLYTRVPPGLTGLWQVSGRNNTTYEERVAFDDYYIRNWSVWMDMYILARTFRAVLHADGAY